MSSRFVRVVGWLLLMALLGFVILSVSEREGSKALMIVGILLCLLCFAYDILILVVGLLLAVVSIGDAIAGKPEAK